jgi:hypothetical protein
MKNRAWLHGLLGLAAAAGIGGCRDYPTKSIYHSPVISSVTVFPSIIGQGDSVLVTVYASDPDGDALVYDWFTDSRLIIKDAPGELMLYNTASNSHVFYRSTYVPRSDTAWVSCYVRDGRGGMDGGRVLVLLRD